MSVEPVTGEEWQKPGSGEQAVTPVLGCKGCGRTRAAADPRLDMPPAEHCWACPPWPCDGCGQMISPAGKCPCYIDA